MVGTAVQSAPSQDASRLYKELSDAFNLKESLTAQDFYRVVMPFIRGEVTEAAPRPEFPAVSGWRLLDACRESLSSEQLVEIRDLSAARATVIVKSENHRDAAFFWEIAGHSAKLISDRGLQSVLGDLKTP